MPPDTTADPAEDGVAGPAVVGVEDFDDELHAASSKDRTTTAIAQEYGYGLTSVTTGPIHPRFTAIATT
jgi:hypothetical protein